MNRPEIFKLIEVRLDGGLKERIEAIILGDWCY